MLCERFMFRFSGKTTARLFGKMLLNELDAIFYCLGIKCTIKTPTQVNVLIFLVLNVFGRLDCSIFTLSRSNSKRPTIRPRIFCVRTIIIVDPFNHLLMSMFALSANILISFMLCLWIQQLVQWSVYHTTVSISFLFSEISILRRLWLSWLGIGRNTFVIVDADFGKIENTCTVGGGQYTGRRGSGVYKPIMLT